MEADNLPEAVWALKPSIKMALAAAASTPLTLAANVLTLDVTLVVSVGGIVWHIFVEEFKRSPRVEVVEERVEGVNLGLWRRHVTQLWNWLLLGESTFGFKHWGPGFDEVVFGLWRRWQDIGAFVNRVELLTLAGVSQGFVGLLDDLEEPVLVQATLSGLLIWVVLQDLLSVGTSQLVFGGSPSQVGDTQDGVQVSGLPLSWVVE
ncbi:hypothetical protein WICPIJ_009645 [Wickerhamomyces pijperi]|uniref:Uncharacterized protein n=1 Tax=Wickerhamomyces pijperi TaxID=599730 RepID=A0A9P8PMI6_WICPI|nr:hypothetical protein WICPIJ_009645 [Wickerhamomyces pijperi]